MRVRDRIKATSPSTRTGVLCGLALLMLLVVRNRDLLFTPHWEDSDWALNSILIDKARHFQLSVGNYSRFGFYHPGPALLYVQALSQLLFRDAIPVFASPFGAQQFGILVLNSVMLGMSATILVRRTGHHSAAIVLALCALAYAWKYHGILTSTWMPYVYVLPFLLLLISAASVASGELADTWKLFLANGLLVHGHISFVMFTVVCTAIVVVALWIQRVRIREALPRRVGWICVALTAIFALPIVLHTAFSYPGEFDDYIDYVRSDDAGGQGLRPALGFVRNYWATGTNGDLIALALFLAAGAAVWRMEAGSSRRFLSGVLGFIVVATSLTWFYAVRGVDDLQFTYLAIFYYTAPLLTLCTIGLASLGLPKTLLQKSAVGAVAVLAGVVLAVQPQMKNPYPTAPWVPEAATKMIAAGNEPIRLRFQLPYWQPAAGLVEEARRRGTEICVDAVHGVYATLFTEKHICTPGDAGRGTHLELVDPASATGPTVYSDTQFALTPVGGN
jgi:hypothetical protein